MRSHLGLLFQSTGYITCRFASLASDIIARASVTLGSKIIADESGLFKKEATGKSLEIQVLLRLCTFATYLQMYLLSVYEQTLILFRIGGHDGWSSVESGRQVSF